MRTATFSAAAPSTKLERPTGYPFTVGTLVQDLMEALGQTELPRIPYPDTASAKGDEAA